MGKLALVNKSDGKVLDYGDSREELEEGAKKMGQSPDSYEIREQTKEDIENDRKGPPIDSNKNVDQNMHNKSKRHAGVIW